MRDSRNDVVNNVAFVQYAFDGKEENVCEKPHQNTKKGKAPSYTRTKSSVVRNIDTNLTWMGPKEAVFLACSRRSDTGERCKVKGSAKK